MSHVVEATYEDGVLKLDRPLPLKDREKVRVTVESLTTAGHSVLEIPPIKLGQVLRPPARDDDLLGEMLEGRP
jgi:predicted DNA-binding antitoxin AbrB/MazE fold protein